MSIYEICSLGETNETVNEIVECTAKTCCNNSLDKSTLQFFLFPNNQILARIWATNARREDILSKSIFATKKYVLCAEHFDDKYFETKEKKTFKKNVDPIPTIFRNNLKYCTKEKPKLLHSKDNIKNKPTENPTMENNMLIDVNLLQNDIYSNVDFGRLTYTDDLYEEFISNPGVLSMKPDVSDRLIKRDYCRLCAKQLPIANLVPIFNRRGRNTYGDMLEMCLPGKFKENDKYPHEICSSCIFKLQECCNILTSFIEADKNIRSIFKNKETVERLSKELNKPKLEQGVEEILNTFEDKSLIMISPDLNKQETESNDRPDSINNTEEFITSIVHPTTENNNIQHPVVHNTTNNINIQHPLFTEKTIFSETSQIKISEEEKHEIKFQCLTCFKLFNNNKQVRDHSLLFHPLKEKNEKVFRTVKAILRKKKNNDVIGNENKNIPINSLPVIINKKINSNKEYDKKFRCDKCSKLFENKKKVLEHAIAVHPTSSENNIVCKLVKVKKKAVNNETKTKEQSSSIRYECLICLSNHRTKETLIKHTRRNHPNLTDGKFLCRILKPKKYRSHNVTCLRCSESFASIVKYHRHMKKHASFKCEKCGITFDKIYKLKRHSKTHKEPIIYNCIGCDEQFTSKKDLLSHEEVHKQPEENVSCPTCKKKFTSAFSLRKHQQVHESSLCNICGKLFSNKVYLQRHLHIHSEERPFKCKVCNKSFKTVTVLAKHKECHAQEKKYICQACGKQFRTSGSFRQHMTIHSEVKKHSCDICGKIFRRKGNLLTHREIHNYIRAYKCKICDIELPDNSSYNIHINKHKNSDEKTFSCMFCHKKFATKFQMQIHHRMHSGDRPYKCKYCENTFRSKATMNQHQLIHSDVFPHACNYCDRKFKRLQSLIVHRRTHTGEKPFPCPICERPFAMRGDMIKHKRIHERKAKKIKELSSSSDESANDSDYMNFVDGDESESNILESLLS